MGTTYSQQTLIFDASVLINLAVTGHCLAIFDSLNSKCLVSQQVLNELGGQTKDYGSRKDVINELIDCNILSVVHLDDKEAAYFIGFVSADDADALDDGEASTLALARSRKAVAVIDEKKGTRIAAQSNPPIMTSSTVDLLYWVSSNNACGLPIAEIIVKSLVQSRMRVPPEHERWILSLIPEEMVPRCTSLKQRLRDNGTLEVKSTCSDNFN